MQKNKKDHKHSKKTNAKKNSKKVVKKPLKKSFFTRKKTIFFIFCLILVITAGFFSYDWLKYNYPQQKISSKQTLLVKKGTGINQLALDLTELKIIDDPKVLTLFIKLNPQYANIKAGSYDLTNVTTLKLLLELLNSGRETQLSFFMPEGLKLKDIKLRLYDLKNLDFITKDLTQQQLFDKLDINPKITNNGKLEGLFFPETYYYTPNSTDLALLKRAYKKLENDLLKIWQQRDKSISLKNPYELLIFASIVQKEAGNQDEMPTIASVFHNRLKINMRLQSDPTIIYGMGDKYKGNISRKDITTPTPYNTYTISGLPPTPISSVSLNALKASANPSKTKFLYFVATGKGGHKFSSNLKQHNQAVREYVKYMRENKQ